MNREQRKYLMARAKEELNKGKFRRSLTSTEIAKIEKLLKKQKGFEEKQREFDMKIDDINMQLRKEFNIWGGTALQNLASIQIVDPKKFEKATQALKKFEERLLFIGREDALEFLEEFRSELKEL